MKALILHLLLLLSSLCPISGNSTTLSTTLQLLPRTRIATPEITLSEPSNVWLKKHQKIKIAIWGEIHPPLFVKYDPAFYEGISADYVNIISRTLKKDVEIYHFSTADEAKNSLQRREVDMLAFYTPSTSDDNNLLISKPYLLDQRVILHNKKLLRDNRLSLNHKKIAFVGDFGIYHMLKEKYPHSELRNYQYYSNAMATLPYGAVDALWLNASTANFLLNQGIENQAKVTLSDLAANANVSFAFHTDNQALYNAVDIALTALPLASRMSIVNNWGLDGRFVMKYNPMVLSREELVWVSKNSEIKVWLPSNMAPISFIDDDGYNNGYVQSLLRLISERTGIHFRPMNDEYASASSQASDSRLKKDLLASQIVDNEDSRGLRYTRSFAISPWVLVVDERRGNTLTLEGKKGLRVAVARYSGVFHELTQRYPQISFIETDNVDQALVFLSNKRVDAAISPQISADYLINKKFHSKLIISNTVDLPPANIAMAVSRDNTQLLNIINKALIDVSPHAIQRDLLPWQNYQAPSRVRVWDNYSRYLIYLAGLSLTIMFIIVLRNRDLKAALLERTRYEQQMEDQLRFIRTLIDDSPVALYVRDSQSRMVQCNNTYLQFLDTTLEDVRGKTLQQTGVMSPACILNFQRLYDNTLLSAEPHLSHQIVNMRGGKQVQVYHWTLPYRDHSGAVTGIIGGFIDITERELLFAELQQAKQIADRASASKSIFLAQMSHEIRTPLNALIGLLELEHRRLSSPHQREQNITAAWQASQSLLILVGNILDMAKIESGVHNIKNVPVSLPDSVQSLITLFGHAAREKNIVLTVTFELNEPDILFDQTMFNQILSNLLSNAIKFTDQGQVEVAVYQGLEKRCNASRYVIEVADSGIGLSEYQKQAIFEPFVQVEVGHKSSQGTGLGLSICRQLVQTLGGELTVESDVGVGTTFIFSFMAEPASASSDYEKNAILPVHNQDKLVLIVDDNAPNRLLLTQQLASVGYRTVAVESAEQALIQWEMAPLPFDVVITDCNMPGMDGFELITRLRKSEKERHLSPRPMFGLTAMAQHEVVTRGKESGMTECLFKPIPLDRLLAQLSEHFFQPVQEETIVSTLQKISKSNPLIFKDLLCSIIESNMQDIQDLKQAITMKDGKNARFYAHRLVGTARMVEANRLVSICREIEQASDNNNWESIVLSFQKCLDEVKHLKNILVQHMD